VHLPTGSRSQSGAIPFLAAQDEMTLPATARPVFVPRGVAVEGGAFRYQSTWQLVGDRLTVRRELIIQRDRGYCIPRDERDFIPIREAMRKDLAAQIIFGE
jgi:hypothetical protein